MPKFAANLTMLFNELPFMERFRAARAGGFDAVEYLFPYAYNYHDMPGFFLNTTAQALALLDAMGSDNLLIQYDIYHAQRMAGELAATMQKHLARIGHMQLADNPGRHAPGTGEINYGFLFKHLDAIGYQRWIGCEYKPAGTTLAGLGWLREAHQPAANPA